MKDLIREILTDIDHPRSVIVMDPEGVEKPRQYLILPRTILQWAGIVLFATILLVFSFIAFTPVRELIPGYGTTEIRMNAERNAERLSALQDSLALQAAYLAQLRGLITGNVTEVAFPPVPAEAMSEELVRSGPTESAEGGSAAPSGRGAVSTVAFRNLPVGDEGDLSAVVPFPVRPPVEGFLTRGFDDANGHFGVDIAVAEGTSIRAIGDGLVVFADWTNDGGNALAIQHANGYLSVYKHNRRLLRQLGDRVRSQEPVAISGNTGEVTTGPHLHFELWHNGLPRNPGEYVLSW